MGRRATMSLLSVLALRFACMVGCVLGVGRLGSVVRAGVDGALVYQCACAWRT